MSYSLIDYLSMFASNFGVVFLLGLQSRNVVAGRYIAAALVSFGISVAQFIFVKYAVTGSFTAFFVCALGGMGGISSSIGFYKHVIEKRAGR